MGANRHGSHRQPWGIILVAFLLLIGLQNEGRAAESGEFSGSWIANGTRELFFFGADRKVYTFNLSGHVNLKTTLGKTKDYWSKCVGISDTATGLVARCTWQDLEGPEIYITLQSDEWQQDKLVTGAIVGGSEELKQIQGALSFRWSALFVQKEGAKEAVTGQALDLRGSYQIP